MPAPEYIEHLMAWVQGNIDNESVFPSRIGMSPTVPSELLSFVLRTLCAANTEPHNPRRALPQDIPNTNPPTFQTTLSGLRTHLLPSLPRHHPAWIGAAPQYQLQALRLVCQ